MRDDDPEFDELDAIGVGVHGRSSRQPISASPLPSRVVRWSRGSAAGAVLTGMALGLREVLDPRRDDDAIVIEVDADGEPHDLPVQLFLEPDDPAGSLCIVRRDPPPPVV